MTREDFERARHDLTMDDMEKALAIALHTCMASNFYDVTMTEFVKDALVSDKNWTKEQLETIAARLTLTKLRGKLQKILGDEKPIAFIERCFPPAYRQYAEALELVRLLDELTEKSGTSQVAKP